MRKIFFFVGLLFSSLVFAGGDTIKVKIISYNSEKKILTFQLLNAVDLKMFGNSSDVTLLLNYECHSSLYSCLTRKREFDRRQYEEAIKYLNKTAIPGQEIEIGFMGAGFYKHKVLANTYVTSGLFISDNLFFVYENPFL